MRYKRKIGKKGTESWIQYIHYIPYLLEIQLCVSSKSEPRGKDKIPIKSICLNKKNSFLLGFNHNNNCNHLFAVLFYWFGRETDRQTLICCLPIFAFIGWFFFVPLLGTEPAALAHQDDAPTKEAAQPGLMATIYGAHLMCQTMLSVLSINLKVTLILLMIK